MFAYEIKVAFRTPNLFSGLVIFIYTSLREDCRW